jgi:hypothetical protein
MAVRFFGGWDFPPELLDRGDWLAEAYGSGVPMGGDLPARSGTAPHFALWAMRDPDSGNLDRLQIVKGWVDAVGHSHERVYDVAWSGDRRLDATGKLPPVGNTVDAARASWRNDIGADQLAAVWIDPDFVEHQAAFYYARVIEIPTPRWTTFDRKALGMPPPARYSVQERAVTSPIWYRP